MNKSLTKTELKMAVVRKGSHFFDRNTVRAFDSILHTGTNKHGFFVEKLPGAPGKREMLRAIKK